CSEFVFRAYDEALPEANDVYSLAINMASPRALAGTRAALPPPTRGRGIEAGSLLDFASTPGVRAVVPRAPAAPPVEPLEALGERYLQQVITARSAEKLAGADVAEVVPDIRRFANAWYAAAPPAAFAMRGPQSTLEHLVQTAADFVTPGDLLHTTSLFTVGDVKS